MRLKAILLAFFLLYFFYLTHSDTVSVHKPSSVLIPSGSVDTPQLTTLGSTLLYSVKSLGRWETRLPDEFTLQNEKIVPIDACHGQPDGTRLLATGKALYEHIRNYQLEMGQPSFESNTDTHFQDKRVFYFTCQHSRIDSVHMCPPGQVFVGDQCQPVDRCTGEENGKRFANVYDVQSFFECEHEKLVAKSCPPHTVFLYDQCVDTTRSSLYCQFHTLPIVLDPQTLLKCVEGRVVYETCPPGYRYFEQPVCQLDACAGKPDGTRLPMPLEHRGPFVFSPGSLVCRQDQIESTQPCPESWDLWQGRDGLTHLPQVYDGSHCTVPTFCDNVQSDDPDILVPAFEFSKHVQNWKRSDVLDRLSGYECRQGKRKRVDLDPGMRISKQFKRESACDGTAAKVPVSGRNEAYYDCPSQTVESCPPNHYFDAVECVPRIPHAFQFQGLDFFRMDTLREDNWMEPWGYDLSPRATPCTDPESEYMETYNLCSHPDCTLYPFLSMISFKLTLRDGSQCVFREHDRRLEKRPTQERYRYWSQSPGDGIDACDPGKNIRTGNFVWDSVLYMTCDDSQPFVFCPSSETTAVEKVAGKKYACITDLMRTIPPHTKIQFAKNEVQKLVADTPTIVSIKGVSVTVPSTGYEISDAFELKTVLESINVEYQHRVTHPADVVLQENPRVSNFGGGFLMKLKDFTLKPLKFPTYNIKERVEDFEL